MQSLPAITSNIYDDGWGLPDTLSSAILHSTLRCSGMVFRQAESMFIMTQHLHDARLSVKELRGMVGCEGEAFSNCVLRYEASLQGTRQYWFKQWSWLIAMVDTLGLPTIFFTHSAADLQWPKLGHLICPDDSECSSSHNRDVLENPAIAN